MVRQITEEERSTMFPVEVEGLYFLFETEEQQRDMISWLGNLFGSSTNFTVAHTLGQVMSQHLQYQDKESPEDTILNMQEHIQESNELVRQLEQDNRNLANQLEQTKAIVNMYKEMNLKGDSEIVKELLGTIKDLTVQLAQASKSSEDKLTEVATKALTEMSSTAKSLQEVQANNKQVIQQVPTMTYQPPVQQMPTPPTMPVHQPPVYPTMQSEQSLTDSQTVATIEPTKELSPTTQSQEPLTDSNEDSEMSLDSMKQIKKKLVPRPKPKPLLEYDKSKMVNTQEGAKEPSLEDIIARNKKMSGG